MKKLIKGGVSIVFLSLLFCLCFGTVAYAETYQGYENGCIWSLDTSTGTLKVDFGDGASTKTWHGYESFVKHIEIANSRIEYYLKFNSIEEFPNLETISGNWHFGEYEPAIIPEAIKPWKKGDPEAYWEINLKTKTLTIDAKGNPFEKYGFFMQFEDSFYHGPVTEIWRNYQDTFNRLVLGDGITSWPFEYETPALFYSLGIDTVKLGKNVEASNGLFFMAKTAYEVDPQNPNLAVYNGALYTKDYKTLLALPYGNPKVQRHPNWQQDGNGTTWGSFGESSWHLNFNTKTLTLSGEGIWHIDGVHPLFRGYRDYIKHVVLEDGVTSLSEGFTWNNFSFDTLQLGKSVSQYTESQLVPDVSFQVDSQNPNFSTYGGVLYTKNLEKLICTPQNQASIRIHPKTKIIGKSAIYITGTTAPVIVPQGVTTIDDWAFDGVPESVPIVLPDTLTAMGPQENTRYNDYCTFFFSDKNQVAAKVSEHGGSIKTDLLPDELKGAKSVIDIYKFTQNGQTSKNAVWVIKGDKKYYYEEGKMVTGFHRINGKAHFFDSNGVMEYDKWKEYNGDWYCLNRYGAGLVKIWLQNGNKWYFMQADGTMAKNKWINWYNKWYYVGADGAMVTNRRTPDGYWVNASGLWEK